MNVFDRVEKLNARICELESQVRAYELEKALRDLLSAVEAEYDYRNAKGSLTQSARDAARAAIARATGQGV